MTGSNVTPGYNARLTIKFRTTANGGRRAFRWSRSQPSRWLPIPVAEAEMLLANGDADLLGVGTLTEADL